VRALTHKQTQGARAWFPRSDQRTPLSVSAARRCRDDASQLIRKQHLGEHRAERPVLLGVDQQLGEGLSAAGAICQTPRFHPDPRRGQCVDEPPRRSSLQACSSLHS
jgi:hypothetical protein